MKRIGILSDSHGRTATTREAIRALCAAGADVLVHLGDIETEAVIDELAGFPAHIVFGNCDWNADVLARHARNVGVQVDDPLGELTVGTRHVAYTHGHLQGLMHQALSDGVDYLLHGHSHQVRDERIGSTRVINPGALFRAARYTAAILDPTEDQLEFLEIPPPS